MGAVDVGIDADIVAAARPAGAVVAIGRGQRVAAVWLTAFDAAARDLTLEAANRAGDGPVKCAAFGRGGAVEPTGAAVVHVVKEVGALAVATGFELVAGVATGPAVLCIAGVDVDARTVATAGARRACVVALPAVVPVTLQIDAFVAAQRRVLIDTIENRVEHAVAVAADLGEGNELAVDAAGAAVVAAGVQIGTGTAAARLPGGACSATRPAIGRIQIKRAADSVAASIPFRTGSAAGSAVVAVAVEIDAGAVATAVIAAARGVAGAAGGRIAGGIDAGASTTRFAAGAGRIAVAAVVLVVVQVVALAVALIETGLAFALVVLARGVVAAIIVLVASPADLLAGGQRGKAAASEEGRHEAAEERPGRNAAGGRESTGESIEARAVHGASVVAEWNA